MIIDSGEARLWDTARAFQPSRVFLSALELGVFTALGGRPNTSEAVAEAIKADPRATNRLMNALVAIGLLVRHDELYGNSPDVEELLVPGKPGYLGDALLHAEYMWQTWSTLSDAVREGGSVHRRDPRQMPERTKAFIAAMHHNASRHAPDIVKLINLAAVRRVLDVGGGSGAYSIALCRAKADLEAVVFDLPEVVGLTKNYVADAGLSDRITTRAGNFLKDDLGSGFDLAWLSQVIHSNSTTENAGLVRKCYGALNPGGRIVLQDFIIEPNRTHPASAAMFSINMLVATPAGDTYTQAEVEDWFRQAGFTDFSRIDPPNSDAAVLIGVKR